MIRHILKHPKCALWAEMGLGKTVTTLSAIDILFQRFEIERVLIIAPHRAVASTWPAEINKWSHLRDLKYMALKGSPEKRLQILNNDLPQITFISLHLVTWLTKHLVDQPWPWDMVVIDESSFFKDAASLRWKALEGLFDHVDRLVQLTGTPAGNGLLNLWAQLYLLDRGQRLGTSFDWFRRRYFDPDYQGYHWTPYDDASTEIYDKVGDICISLSADDYLSLPREIPVIHDVVLPVINQKDYRRLERDFLLTIEDKTITALSKAALYQKLQQFANGALYDEDRKWYGVHDRKLDELELIREEANGTPILVTYTYKFDLEMLKARFPDAVVLNTAQEKAWNEGRIPMAIIHPRSSYSLNIQYGGNIIVWYGLTWSLDDTRQLNARLRRVGQEKPVFVHYLITQGTVDEDIFRTVKYEKQLTQEELIDAVKLRHQDL